MYNEAACYFTNNMVAIATCMCLVLLAVGTGALLYKDGLEWTDTL